MANNQARSHSQAVRAQRIWTFIAATTAGGALVVVPLIAPDAEAAPVQDSAAVLAAAAQPLAAPSVVRKGVTIEANAAKDRRSVDTGMGVWNATAFVWGYTWEGISGGLSNSDSTTSNNPPRPVTGLPQGAILDMAGGIYNMNALDTSGCVWGWGTYPYRDGTGNSGVGRSQSAPPKILRIGSHWADTSKPQFCSAIAITNSEQAGAAITEDGLVYSWGAAAYGGTGYGSSSKRPGAQPVLGLPDPTIEGNRPVEVSGGYQTIWVILENGDVYYFGKSGGLWERPALDDQGYPDGNQPSWSGEGNKKTVEVYAKKSVSLKDWFRENNPGEYIVHIHSGIGFGAAVLSTGRVLSWGYGHGSALGRTCTDYGKAGDPCDQNFPASYTGEDGMTHEGWGGLRQGRMPGYVALPADTRIVGQACAFTAAVGLADNGDLWAWAKVDSYENVGSVKPVNPEDEEEVEGEDKPTGGGDPDDDGSFDDGMADFRNGAARLATNVEEFQVGQGYILWRKADGQWWGQGYNPRGSVGHKASMLSSGAAGYKYAHELWFAGKDYSSCTKTKNNTPDDATIDLTAGGCGNKTKNEAINAKDTATPGAWSHRFSLQQFVAAKGTLN